MYFYLKSKCPQSLHVGLHDLKRKRGGEAPNNVSFCNAGRCGTRTFDSAGMPDRRSPEPDHLAPPPLGDLCLFTVLPFLHRRQRTRSVEPLCGVKTNPNGSVLCWRPCPRSLFTPVRFLEGSCASGCQVARAPMSAAHVYVHQT